MFDGKHTGTVQLKYEVREMLALVKLYELHWDAGGGLVGIL